MKIRNPYHAAKIFVVAVFLVSGCFALIPATNGSVTAGNIPAEYESQASTYRTYCSKCHGSDGRANTKEGRRTEATDLTDESVKAMSTDKMTRIIKNGKAEMPGFGKKLSASKIAGLVQYVRGL